MASPTTSFFFFFFILFSFFLPLLACSTCPPPYKTKHKPVLPPVTLPPPPHYKKPLPPPSPRHPKVNKPCPPPPPHTVKPSLPMPPPVPIIPPVTPVPVYLPPPPPPQREEGRCPIDALKLGACVDLLGGLIHVGLGDPVVNQCCPILKGLLEIEAAVCLCTTLKLKLLNLTIYAPLALELLITCQKNPPPGYTCTL